MVPLTRQTRLLPLPIWGVVRINKNESSPPSFRPLVDSVFLSAAPLCSHLSAQPPALPRGPAGRGLGRQPAELPRGMGGLGLNEPGQAASPRGLGSIETDLIGVGDAGVG